MGIAQDIIDRVMKNHPEIVAEAEAEARKAEQAAAAAVKPYGFYDVVRHLAQVAGMLGGPDVALAAKVAEAIAQHEAEHARAAAAHPAPPAAPEPAPEPAQPEA